MQNEYFFFTEAFLRKYIPKIKSRICVTLLVSAMPYGSKYFPQLLYIIFGRIVSFVCPIQSKQLCLKKKKLMPWIGKALIESRRKCRILYIKATNSLECKNKCIKCGNIINRLKQIREKEYFHNKVTSFKGDSTCNTV